MEVVVNPQQTIDSSIQAMPTETVHASNESYMEAAVAALKGEEPKPEVSDLPAVEVSEDGEVSVDGEVAGDVSEDGEEPSEEGVDGKVAEEPKEVVSKEFDEFKDKAQRQAKALQKRIKQESQKAAQLQAQVDALKGEGIELARQIIDVRRRGDLTKMFELVGLKPEHVVDFYAKYIDPADLKDMSVADSIKVNMKKKEVDEKERAITAKNAEIERQTLKTTVRGALNKLAEHVPVVTAVSAVLGDKVEDLIIAEVHKRWSENDPDIRGCKDIPSAVKKVLPDFERQYRKQYRPLIDAFSKLDTSKAQKVEQKPEAKNEEKKAPVKAPEVKDKVEPKPKKPVAQGAPGKKGSAPAKELSSPEDYREAAVRAFLNS